MKHYKQTSKTPLFELAGYTEEFGENLKDRKARAYARACFRQLKLTKE